MSERTAVQNPLIRYAEAAGWECVRPDDALAWLRGEHSVSSATNSSVLSSKIS